ncbi:terpenoid cyclases/protein prenyltransferase alpha-alpha toroid [Kalaharituber pfeilii]|nr:terpenoid cyclases/protein prenyltransferase alpha-alpha toroid [Kalaharituber pfeilii]
MSTEAASAVPSPTAPDEPILNAAKHLKYWLRCLKSPLPTPYTTTDLSRLSLAFFSVSALDLLGALHTHTTESERAEWISWIYSCQLPGGGFRGSPATAGTGEVWDVANLPACYFALAALAVLGDGFGGMNWVGLAKVLKSLQREDGGFGEWVLKGGMGIRGEEGDAVMGGEDMRFMYCACAVRWFLKGGEKGRRVIEGVEDIDVGKAVRFIMNSTTYDHGFSAYPFVEAHAGHAYCAVAALSLLGRLDVLEEADKNVPGIPNTVPGQPSLRGIIKWLVDRQVGYVPELDSPDRSRTSSPFEETETGEPSSTKSITISAPSSSPTAPISPRPPLPPLQPPKEPLTAGFSGRPNKPADTCYSFWVCGALSILSSSHLIHVPANRRFLLQLTQHLIGGFGKLPGVEWRPDVLHSYLGLAALGVLREPGIKEVDAALCVARDVKWRWEGTEV